MVRSHSLSILSSSSEIVKVPTDWWTPQVIVNTVSLFLMIGVNSVAVKYQQNKYGFNHGIFSTWYMFIGEILNLYLFHLRIFPIKSYRQNYFIEMAQTTRDESLLGEPSPYWMALTSLFDVVGSSLAYISLLMIPASVYQMLVGGAIFATAIMSRVMIKRPIYRHQLFACT
jgi:drug/metabolite transporter (DMT)-like permease